MHQIEGTDGVDKAVMAALRALCLGLWIIITGSSCVNGRDGADAAATQSFTLNLLAYLYNDDGNCVHNFRQASEWGKQGCSRAPRSRCALDVHFDASANLTVLSTTTQRYASELSAITNNVTGCSTSVAAVLAQPAVQTTSSSFNQSVATKNDVHVVADCESLGNAQASKLATKEQYKYLISAQGMLATQARALSQSSCLNQIAAPGSNERAWVDNVASGALILETTCFYGSNASPTLCTTAEKAEATRFDFVNAL